MRMGGVGVGSAVAEVAAWGDGVLPTQMELSCGARDLTAKTTQQEAREEEEEGERVGRGGDQEEVREVRTVGKHVDGAPALCLERLSKGVEGRNGEAGREGEMGQENKGLRGEREGRREGRGSGWKGRRFRHSREQSGNQ